MAINVKNIAADWELNAEQAADVRNELRRCVEELARLHEEMQQDQRRIEASSIRTDAMLAQLRAELKSGLSVPVS
jgi:hypothetical protein